MNLAQQMPLDHMLLVTPEGDTASSFVLLQLHEVQPDARVIAIDLYGTDPRYGQVGAELIEDADEAVEQIAALGRIVRDRRRAGAKHELIVLLIRGLERLSVSQRGRLYVLLQQKPAGVMVVAQTAPDVQVLEDHATQFRTTVLCAETRDQYRAIVGTATGLGADNGVGEGEVLVGVDGAWKTVVLA